MVTNLLLILLGPIFLSNVCVLAKELGFPKKVQIVGLFDEDEAIQRMFESSVKAVNKDRHENEELSNVYLRAETQKIETDDLFEASSKGETDSEC